MDRAATDVDRDRQGRPLPADPSAADLDGYRSRIRVVGPGDPMPEAGQAALDQINEQDLDDRLRRASERR